MADGYVVGCWLNSPKSGKKKRVFFIRYMYSTLDGEPLDEGDKGVEWCLTAEGAHIFATKEEAEEKAKEIRELEYAEGDIVFVVPLDDVHMGGSSKGYGD